MKGIPSKPFGRCEAVEEESRHAVIHVTIHGCLQYAEC